MSKELVDAILRFTERQPGPPPYATPIDGLYVLRSDHPKPPTRRLAQPAMCVVVQGTKWATVGDHRVEYGAGQALVVGVETPSLGRVVEATPDKPCLVLVFPLDLAIMRSVIEGMDTPPQVAGYLGRSIFVTDFDGPLAECALRLVRLLDTPNAIPTLHPMIMREMAYWLLSGPHGGDIARLALTDSPSQRVMQAVRHLRSHFTSAVRIEELARLAQLSVTAFHRQFKALTALTPLQYQKQLRLLEARRLLASRAVNVEAVAMEVGYQSPSQFSREYARMFGAPPKRDTTHLKSMLSTATI